MRSFFWILLALTVSTALGQITFEMNAKGLTSLMYGGRNWIGKYERETYIYENNTIISRVLSKTLYSPNEARWAYSWGSINLQVAVDNATSTAYLTLVVNNTLGSLVLTSIRGDLATISYPTNIAQYDGNNVLLNTNIGGPSVLVTSWEATETYPAGKLSIRNEDVTKPLLSGYPWAYDRPTSHNFPLFTHTFRNFMLPTSLPTIVRPILPGQIDSWTISLRWSEADSTDNPNQDIQDTFADEYPMLLNWPDRRPIGQLFVAEHTKKSPINPRGYFMNKDLDTKNHTQMQRAVDLYINSSLSALALIDCQGVVVWDVEGEYSTNNNTCYPILILDAGQQYPHTTTYIGDPKQVEGGDFDQYVDQFFKAFTDAGYLVGVTVRPQYLNYTEGFQREVPDEQAVQLVIDKIAYAKQRWGARLFYMDSNGDPSNPTSGVLMRRVFLEHPDILFMPESQTPVYYSFSAPFEDIRVNAKFTPRKVLSIYPGAFSTLATVDELLIGISNNETFNTMIDSVAAGNILFFRAWFKDTETMLIKEIYEQAETMYPPSGFDAPTVWPDDLAPYVPSSPKPIVSQTSNSPGGVNLAAPISCFTALLCLATVALVY